MLSCVKAVIADLHVPVTQNVQFKHTGGYFHPVGWPETSSVLLRHQINQAEGQAYSVGRAGSVALEATAPAPLLRQT